jgi:hypothetical protein
MGWFGPLTALTRRVEHHRLWKHKLTRLLGGIAFVFVTGAIYAGVEPDFGWDRHSLQLTLAMTFGLVLITFLANHSALWFARVRYRRRGQMRMRPGALFVALFCVLLSRAIHFEPGYIYGLVAGFAFSGELPRQQSGRVVLTWASWMLALGVGGWLLLSPAKHWAAQNGHSFWAPVVAELAAAVVVESLTILILALVPLSFLEGEHLWKWRRAVWIGFYAIVMFAFLHIVVHPEFAGRKTDIPLVTWLAMFIGFSVVSVSFWSYFRFRPSAKRETA